MTTEIREKKRKLREETLRDIAGLDPIYAATAGSQLLAHLTELETYRKAGTVFCYVGMGHEINTAPLLRRVLYDGKRLAVPLCVAKGRMEARQINAMEELMTGWHGIREPAISSPLVRPEEIDFAVIPCICCSYDGKRLGQGGGFYDIYFADYPSIPSAMLCREQVIREQIPTEPHDINFDTVITEKGVYVKGKLQPIL